MGTAQTIEAMRVLGREHQLSFERERWRTDEITGVTEKIAAPMRNTFPYELKEDGLYFQGQRIDRILDKAIAVNLEVVKAQPQFMTELQRNYVEREEYDQERLLAEGLAPHGADILAVISTVPEAVMQGVDLGAYDKKRMKTLVRIYQKTDTGIDATSLSLDLSDRDGVRSIARLFGQEIPEDATSLEILSMRFWGHSGAIRRDAVSMVREVYDKVLSDKFGGSWFAGRQDAEIIDALTFVEMQSDLIDQHMAEIERIHLSGGDKQALKEARHNFAAFITRRLRGQEDVTSLADAGAIATANGESYTGDCPEATTAAQAVAELMGERHMTCPFCGLTTYGDPCASRLVCSKCSAEVNNGRIVSKGIGRQNALALMKSKHAFQKEVLEKENEQFMNRRAFAKSLFGKLVEIRYEIEVGGASWIAYDPSTGQDIEKI